MKLVAAAAGGATTGTSSGFAGFGIFPFNAHGNDGSNTVGQLIFVFVFAFFEIFLFFYYPSDEYTSYLTTIDELEFYDEIDCGDLFNDKNVRERIMIFRLIPM